MDEQNTFSPVMGEIVARLRTLEGKYSILGERLLIINKTMIEEYKKIIKQIKDIDEDLKECKKDISLLKEITKDFNKELQTFAKKENIKILEKYINLWNPMNFITEEDVKKLIKNERLANRRD